MTAVDNLFARGVRMVHLAAHAARGVALGVVVTAVAQAVLGGIAKDHVHLVRSADEVRALASSLAGQPLRRR